MAEAYVTDMDLRPLQSHNTPKEYGSILACHTWSDETDRVYSRFETAYRRNITELA